MNVLLVYIREAHAIDGPAPMPARGQPLVEEPRTLEERRAVASRCLRELGLAHVPAVVDDMDDGVAGLYAAAPDRLYLLDAEGRIAYQGAPGPFGFSVDELAAAIRERLLAE